MKKKGELLIENVIFIILNLIFISIMIVFIANQSSSSAVLEEVYSKKVALLVDGSKPGTIIQINMRDILKEKGFEKFENIFSFENNKVNVNIGSQGGYSYHYFNSVEVNAYPALDDSGDYSGMYVITINENEQV